VACTPTTQNWHAFGAQQYFKPLGYQALPGMGIVAGLALHGTQYMVNTYLYIAAASPAPGGYIRIDQVDTNDNLMHSGQNGFVVWMPDWYPSYRTQNEIGLKMVQSAFPVGNYLYVTWRDLWNAKIYKAVVQTYDDDDNENTWITRSDWTFLESNRGVRLQKGDGTQVTEVKFAHTDMGDEVWQSWLYGRY
jgi:hypothetical protein